MHTNTYPQHPQWKQKQCRGRIRVPLWAKYIISLWKISSLSDQWGNFNQNTIIGPGIRLCPHACRFLSWFATMKQVKWLVVVRKHRRLLVLFTPAFSPSVWKHFPVSTFQTVCQQAFLAAEHGIRSWTWTLVWFLEFFLSPQAPFYFFSSFVLLGSSRWLFGSGSFSLRHCGRIRVRQ